MGYDFIIFGGVKLGSRLKIYVSTPRSGWISKKMALYSDLPDFKSYVDIQSERETRKKKYYKKLNIA